MTVRGNTLLVCNGGDNALCEIDIPSGKVIGYRPAGYFPCAITLDHSGRHALGHRARELGYDLTREELDDLYKRFTDVADHRKKGLMDEEIVSLIQTSREEALKVAAH